jgi:hypothetical protein
MVIVDIVELPNGADPHDGCKKIIFVQDELKKIISQGERQPRNYSPPKEEKDIAEPCHQIINLHDVETSLNYDGVGQPFAND